MNPDIERARLNIKRLHIEISTLQWQLAVEQENLQKLLNPTMSLGDNPFGSRFC